MAKTPWPSKWSPHSTKTAFSAKRVTYTADPKGVGGFRPHIADSEIYVVNADGSGLTNITNNPADDWDPAWSLR